MLNKLALAIKTAGLNHKQVNEVLIMDTPEQAGKSYPLLRIWPNGVEVRSLEPRASIYRFVIAISDRHEDDSTSQMEVLSDCTAIALDILATLNYMYRADMVTWFISDIVEHGKDKTPDVVGGATVSLQARVPFNNDFCQVPSHDFDFPSVGLLAYNVIDEGFSNTTYTGQNTIEGGIA